MHFEDGASPPTEIIENWISLVENTFYAGNRGDNSVKPCIAIHCVAGLGRYRYTIGTFTPRLSTHVVLLLELQYWLQSL